MSKPKILIQLDSDPHPSVFDRVVAVDSGVDHLFSYSNVKPEQIRDFVHGAVFTRGPEDVRRTAFFIGGADVAAGEALLAELKKTFLECGRSVSVLLDSNGANTTAAAAVRAASKHMDIGNAHALVLGGTGPVGQRVVRLLAKQGAHVRIASRQVQRAEAVCAAIRATLPHARLEAVASASASDGPAAMEGRDLVVAAGAAGVVLLPKKHWFGHPGLRLLIDLNAVPPVGIEGVEIFDRGKDREGIICYGAIGVGNTKMKIHRTTIAELFESQSRIFDAEEVYEIALRF